MATVRRSLGVVSAKIEALMRKRGFPAPKAPNKRQLLWAEWLREDVLFPVAHRNVVLTFPRLLRPLFRRRQELLGQLARAGADAVKELVRLSTGSAVWPRAPARRDRRAHGSAGSARRDGGSVSGCTTGTGSTRPYGPSSFAATLLRSSTIRAAR